MLRATAHAFETLIDTRTDDTRPLPWYVPAHVARQLLPKVPGMFAPAAWTRLRPYRARLALCVGAFVLLSWWIASATRAVQDEEFREELQLQTAPLDTLPPSVAPQPLPLPRIAPVLPEEAACAALRGRQSCCEVHKESHGVCWYRDDGSFYMYLRHPIIGSRLEPVPVEETNLDTGRVRQATRYRHVSVMYRSWDDVTMLSRFSEAYCLQSCIERLHMDFSTPSLNGR